MISYPFGAIETYVFIVIAFIVFFLFCKRKNSWIPMAFVVLALSILAYYVEPNETDDLARYFENLINIKEGGREWINRAKELGWNSWDDFPVCAEYFYFISLFPSVHYMPAVTIFIVYGLMFFIMYRAAQRFRVDKIYLLIACLFVLSTYWYYDTFSGIRNGLVFAVIFACMYYHLVEKKHILLCYLGYILACLLHSAGAILVVIVFSAMLTRKIGGKFVTPITLFGITFGSVLLEWLAAVTNSGFFDTLAEKADRHSSTGHFWMQTIFIVNVVVLIVSVLMFLYLRWYFKVDRRGKDLDLFIQFATILAFFMFGSITSHLVFLRIARWIIPPTMAILFMVGMQIQTDMIKAQPGKNYNFEAPPPERWRYQNKNTVLFIFCAFIVVHFYYLCAGSSLNWMHF